MPAQPLSPEQKADAQRLQTLFTAWKTDRKSRGEPNSQEWAADQLGFGQSALSQYLNGRIPLNNAAAAKFSKLLGCKISDFSPMLSNTLAELAGVATADPVQEDRPSDPMDLTALHRLELHLVLLFRDLSADGKDEVLALANKLHNVVKPVKSEANPWAHVAPPPTIAPAPKPVAKAKGKGRADVNH